MKKMNLSGYVILILMILNFNIIPGNAAVVSSIPDAYNITGVVEHKQINGLACGPGALEIIFDFWGHDIDQRAIADVARLSKGTYTWDMARTGHFSYLSEAKGSFFPHDAPTAGFTERPVGYATFNYSSDTFWWTDLKALVASNIPVVLLMKYAPNDDTGHYRVIVGYDENKAEVYFMDPWDRDLGRVKNPDGTVTWNMTDFQYAWNYSKFGASHPYWGAVIMPWSLNLSTSGRTTAGSILKVTADITYPCPRPFDCSAFPASDTTSEIILPQGTQLKKYIGDIKAGESYTVTWNVRLNTDSAGSNITIKTEGLVSGAVPDVIWSGVFYPAYSYTDKIGGEASINI